MNDEALTEKIAELDLRMYQGTFDEDYLIAQWWDLLVSTGDIDVLVASSAHPLSGFLSLFKSPNVLAYTVRDNAIESAHWLEPVSTSQRAVFLSSWCNSKLRGTKRHATLMTTVYELIFAMQKKTIIGITKQQTLLDLHRKMGYVILDAVPDLFDSEQGWVMYLTEDSFKASRLYAAAVKIKQKEYDKWAEEKVQEAQAI